MQAAPNPSTRSDAAAAFSLLSAEAVRSRAHRMLALGLDDHLPYFRVDSARIDPVVDLVIAVTRAAYPSLDVPFHARWRHFVAQGVDRWASLSDAAKWQDRNARARSACDLAIVSVLLDAGAGPGWRYRDPVTDESIGRSEGLALASLAMFAEGVFSARPDDPLRVDAAALQQLSPGAIERSFQLSPSNALVGIEGRLSLLRRLGGIVSALPNVFGRSDTPRPGGIFDHLVACSTAGRIAAPRILSEILIHLGPVWPSRLTLGGVPLGDCWRHPSLVTGDSTNGLVPLHKLSQWLTYSLIEPLQAAGIEVDDVDGLTGLAEYRNGGLFIDAGVLMPRGSGDIKRVHDVSSPFVVEWRALTVALLDRVAEAMRRKLGRDATSFPLAKVLEGGTWAAGRKLAYERRADGAPPIRIASDATVF